MDGGTWVSLYCHKVGGKIIRCKGMGKKEGGPEECGKDLK